MSKTKLIATNPRLDYFQNDVYSISNTEASLKTHYSQTTLDNDPIVFTIYAGRNESINFSQHFLKLKVRIVKANGDPIEAAFNNHFALVNNSLHALFKHVVVEMEGIKITNAVDIYHIKSYIDALFSASKNNLNTLEMQGFFPDEGAAPQTFVADDTNPSLHKRAQMARQSREFELFGPLYIDFFKNNKNVHSNTRIDIKLFRNDPAFYIWRDEHNAGNEDNPNILGDLKCEIREAHFLVRHEKHLDSIVNSIEKTLMTGKNIVTRQQL